MSQESDRTIMSRIFDAVETGQPTFNLKICSVDVTPENVDEIACGLVKEYGSRLIKLLGSFDPFLFGHDASFQKQRMDVMSGRCNKLFYLKIIPCVEGELQYTPTHTKNRPY